MLSELTIIIPAKNEAGYIGRLLDSVCQQDYPALATTPIYVADAASTDQTRELVLAYQDRLNIQVIHGGLPAVGRNAGARLAQTGYVLFVDADIILRDRDVISKALALARAKNKRCVTAFLVCQHGSIVDHVFYAVCNLAQLISRLDRPYATGMFLLMEKKLFDQLGGFDEGILYAEDYALTQAVPKEHFGIVFGYVLATNRRFRNMGRWRVARLYVQAIKHRREPGFFRQDHDYWRF